ncbi:hypothetical protein GCM10025868_10370 [Angustibacter aerolatus]|uniref:Peptidase S9A N-terminal domain-containing protein n=1 Tax=Angustibacter aerolatus TaxID=1162965 RepID=A0ABQ6JFT8_9ACTN|nr:hypothetical protein GCM10025868_10370 [Angustibacter aerolatus]
MRRVAGQEHAVLLTVDPDGTERVLVDPAALDPAGLTTLDAWQPSKEGHLLAYQAQRGRPRGVGAAGARRRDRRGRRRADRPGALLPVAWLPGGEAFYYVRRLDPAGLPESEQQYHRRVWLHRVGTDPASDEPGLRRGAGEDQLLRRLGVDGRSLAGGERRRRHRTAQRPVAGRPAGRRPRAPRPAGGAAGCRRADRRARRP